MELYRVEVGVLSHLFSSGGGCMDCGFTCEIELDKDFEKKCVLVDKETLDYIKSLRNVKFSVWKLEEKDN